jgi:MFS family permease
MIADTGADHERGRQITTMSAMESAGRLISPALGGLLAVFWDIRAPFVAHAIICLIAIIPSYKLVKETAPHLARGGARRQQAADDGTPDPGMKALLIYPVIMFFVAQFFASFARGPIFTGQLNLYGAYAYHMGPPQIALLATITGAVAIPVSLSSGYIMDHFGRKATLVPGFTLMTLAFGFLALTAIVPDVPFELFMAAYLAVYACVSLTGGNMQTLGSDIAPARVRGQFYGVSQTLGNLGGPMATSTFAIFSTTVGYWSGFIFLGATAGVAAFVLGTQVRDRLREERRTQAAVSS